MINEILDHICVENSITMLKMDLFGPTYNFYFMTFPPKFQKNK